MPKIGHEVLRDVALRIFQATGLPDEDARTISDHLVDSNLCGHDSHGVWLVPRYVGSMRDGAYVGWEAHEVVRESAALAVIDGHGANGIVAMTNVVDLVVEKARASTFGAVTLRDVTHIARLGHYTPLVAEQGMVAMLWTNVGGMFMSPFGSADRRLRPSPMSFAVPRRTGPPFMLDMSLSVVAGGKIRQMVANDKPLPDGWLIDQEGRYLSDGRRYDDLDTAILPLGDMQFGHKGSGLNMMMEMIVGPLSLAGCTRSELESEGGGGVMLLAVDIQAFTGVDSFTGEVEGLADWVHSARPLPGFGRVYVPGEIEEETRRRRRQEGVEIPDVYWEGVCRVADELDVTVPSV